MLLAAGVSRLDFFPGLIARMHVLNRFLCLYDKSSEWEKRM